MTKPNDDDLRATAVELGNMKEGFAHWTPVERVEHWRMEMIEHGPAILARFVELSESYDNAECETDAHGPWCRKYKHMEIERDELRAQLVQEKQITKDAVNILRAQLQRISFASGQIPHSTSEADLRKGLVAAVARREELEANLTEFQNFAAKTDDELESLVAKLDEAQLDTARLEAVKALHSPYSEPYKPGDPDHCEYCTHLASGALERQDDYLWPCPTYRAATAQPNDPLCSECGFPVPPNEDTGACEAYGGTTRCKAAPPNDAGASEETG